MSRKIGSRRSSISPEFVDCSVLIYNGKTPVRCKITEGKVGHKFGEFAFILHGDEDPIEQIEERAERRFLDED
jgi:ribosomal protein S19